MADGDRAPTIVVLSPHPTEIRSGLNGTPAIVVGKHEGPGLAGCRDSYGGPSLAAPMRTAIIRRFTAAAGAGYVQRAASSWAEYATVYQCGGSKHASNRNECRIPGALNISGLDGGNGGSPDHRPRRRCQPPMALHADRSRGRTGRAGGGRRCARPSTGAHPD